MQFLVTRGFNYHIKCGKVTLKQYKEILENDPMIWNCPKCAQQSTEDLVLSSSFPYASLSEELFLSVAGLTPPANLSSSFSKREERHTSYLPDLAQQLEASSAKDLRVAHFKTYAA